MERAFEESKDDPLFGLWASLGLELLARSAIASVSPTLLAKPDRDHRYLLHALGRGSERVPKKSLASVQVLQLCSTLFDEFSDEEKSVATAIINRRNEELHSGTCAFEEYPSSKWLAGFYRACKVLCECQGKELSDLFGDEEAKNAEELLGEKRAEVKGQVESKIAAHRKVFESKSKKEREEASKAADKEATKLSWHGHHKAECPACHSQASITGEAYGREKVSHEDGDVVVRQPVSPLGFNCTACGLKLTGYAELEVAGLGGRYTRTSTYSPEDYFGLVDPDTFEPGLEYDNE
ncbi:TPA: hypothetical protein DE059_01780 [Candidatus Peribacteria bacterium]|jgi:hypothetical protein|nr:hypothetical protein [Candidatus Peribacteria bacterium]